MRATRVCLAPLRATNQLTISKPLARGCCPSSFVLNRHVGCDETAGSRTCEITLKSNAQASRRYLRCNHGGAKKFVNITNVAPRASLLSRQNSRSYIIRRFVSDDAHPPSPTWKTRPLVRKHFALSSQRDSEESHTPIRGDLSRGDQSLAGTALEPEQFSKDVLQRLTEHIQSEQAPSVVVLSKSTNPYYNLSLEHYLLTNSNHDSRILFLYDNGPCVVYGRNQNPWVECNLAKITEGLPHELVAANATIELIRRRSGGGTVFHDAGNLNYCAIVPNDKSFTRNTHAEMVVRALQSVQRQRDDFAVDKEIKVNERHDIVMRARNSSIESEPWLKVSGSAYKLTRGRALHHGTLLFDSWNLDRISDLLNGPGRPLITTKGVGSVRSPVGNMLSVADGISWDERSVIRRTVKGKLKDAIADEWLKLYPTDRANTHSMNVGSIVTEIENGKGEAPKKLVLGMSELASPEWRYGQTPRCTFEAAANGEESVKLRIEINRGVVEMAQIVTSEGSVSHTADLEQTSTQQVLSLRVWEIEDWATWLKVVFKEYPNVHLLLTESSQNGEPDQQDQQAGMGIAQKLQQCFPCLVRPN